MPRITHIELNADMPDKLGKFYSSVFGWMMQKKQTGTEDYWFLFSGPSGNPGINAGMKKRMGKGLHWIPTIHVDSLDEALEKVTSNGGKITHPKRGITATGYLAYCEDPEGNLFGLLEKSSDVG
jgi:predicted enzyme related to lactoylglutathione lyase